MVSPSKYSRDYQEISGLLLKYFTKRGIIKEKSNTQNLLPNQLVAVIHDTPNGQEWFRPESNTFCIISNYEK